jgi:ABC-type antimicrobial peptide transport system permease subunit
VFREETADFRGSTSVTSAHYFSISPGYLNAAGTLILSGRDFTWADTPESPKVAIINQTLARRLFGDAQVIGRKFRTGDTSIHEVVGVVEDGKYDSLTESPSAAMFFALAQAPAGDTTLAVRSKLPFSEVAPSVSRTLNRIDPSLPFTVETWLDALGLVLFPVRVATAALGVMGLLAAMLAITGVFGMASYSVSKRMRELGIRAAMGARQTQLLRSALARPMVLLLAGSGLGLAGGVFASRLAGLPCL